MAESRTKIIYYAENVLVIVKNIIQYNTISIARCYLSASYWKFQETFTFGGENGGEKWVNVGNRGGRWGTVDFQAIKLEYLERNSSRREIKHSSIKKKTKHLLETYCLGKRSFQKRKTFKERFHFSKEKKTFKDLVIEKKVISDCCLQKNS